MSRYGRADGRGQAHGRPVGGWASRGHCGQARGELGCLDDQARGAVPPEDLKHHPQMRGNIVQDQPAAALVCPAGSGQPEDGPQARQITERQLSQADVNVALAGSKIF